MAKFCKFDPRKSHDFVRAFKTRQDLKVQRKSSALSSVNIKTRGQSEIVDLAIFYDFK